MAKVTTLFLFIIYCSNLNYGVVVYDNGEYNYITTFIDDEVRVFDSDTQMPTTIDVQTNGHIFQSLWLYGSSNLILNGGSIGDYGRDVFAFANSYVEIKSGYIRRYLVLNGYSQGNIYGGTIYDTVSTYDDTELNVYDGHIGRTDRDFLISGNSKVYFYGGTVGRYLHLSNQGSLYMEGGNVNNYTTLNNNSRLVMAGGNLGNNLYIEDSSSVEIKGGWVDGTIYARHNSEVTIFGTNFNYPLGYIQDSYGVITGFLLNGDPISSQFIREGEGSILLKNPNIVLTVISPDGGERYLTENHVMVEYQLDGDISVPTVDIDYSLDNGLSWTSIITGTLNSGIYEWATPNIESEQCLIRVSSSDNPTITDNSDEPFVIFACSEINPADINNDCYVNFYDFELFVENWLWCGDRYNPDCGL
ncbi:hypothetical protein SMSP2_01102 [Limihaloglobus sulfuriphilus]|uniref:Uncharacterized protein n=1 Tax=Limihaloglobus sulfuriphilus TaxID=1851148 RepID=A0A1Q2MDH5_9BACT|nr:hypothetical protein [Limihaloglobus sulfuriphilus]AQQ70741.1 hypothetical protein SMSP2_01102 [Limihaloglobus sulfuriphilus]